MKETTKQLWLGDRRGWRWLVYTLIFLLFMALLGWGFPTLVDKAWSTPTSIPVPKSGPAPAVHVANFKDGDYGHVDRIPTGKWFANPKIAKEAVVDKLVVKVKNRCHDKNAPAICKNNMRPHGKARATCDRCIAYEIYKDMVNNANCSGKGSPIPANQLCHFSFPGDGPQLTKKQVQIGGTVALCGASAALTIRGGGLLAGLVGGAGCAWALWAAVDEE